MHSEGTFDAKVTDHGFAPGNKGPQLWVKFETSEGNIAGWFSFTDKAAQHTVKKIRNIGYQGDNIEQLNDGVSMRGMLCSIVVEHEEYDGKTRAKVAFVNRLGDTGGSLDRDDAAARNAARFNALLRQADKLEPTRVDEPENPAPDYDEMNPPPLLDDDLPF
jgi:hypothetical protein